MKHTDESARPATLAEVFRAEHDCDERTCEMRLFWRALHRGALPVVWIGGVLAPRTCARDWELVRAVAQCRTLRQIEDEIRDFSIDPVNRSWWRRVLRVRISTRRLRRAAREYLGAPRTVTGAAEAVNP